MPALFVAFGAILTKAKSVSYDGSFLPQAASLMIEGQGGTVIARGDLIESCRHKGDEIVQSNDESERQILIEDARLVLRFRRQGDWLSLKSEAGKARICLQRIAEAEAAGNAS